MLVKSLQHKVEESESVHACEMQDLQRQLDRQREMAIQFSQQVCVCVSLSLSLRSHFSLASLLKNVLSWHWWLSILVRSVHFLLPCQVSELQKEHSLTKLKIEETERALDVEKTLSSKLYDDVGVFASCGTIALCYSRSDMLKIV